MNSKTLIDYLKFIGIYLLIFFIGDIIPIEINLLVAIALGFVCMVAVFIRVIKRPDFKVIEFSVCNLTATIVFCTITILYDKIYGLTEFIRTNESVIIQNSKFYKNTLSLNHAIILSAVILFFYSLIVREIKLIGITALTVATIIAYFIIIV